MAIDDFNYTKSSIKSIEGKQVYIFKLLAGLNIELPYIVQLGKGFSSF